MSKEEIQKIVKQELEIYNFDDPFDYERASLNITDKLSNRLGKLVMPKIAEVFERYLRSESEYPSIDWGEKTVEQYRNDRRYRKDVYEDMKWQNHFSYAFEFAKKRLFEKIVKETLESNFPA